MRQQDIDVKNAEFWDELCGSSLARSIGITGISYENLRRFDDAYLAFYPYLAGYVLQEDLRNKRVLEIGLGYGTLGNLLVSQGADYCGVDIANGPLTMMRYRLSCLEHTTEDRVQRGSALKLPYKNESFDYIYTVGCLHHTGDLNRAVSEVYRLLKPGAKGIVMLYNRHSFRQIVMVSVMRVINILSGNERGQTARSVRALYDMNARGEAAPYTDYVSRAEVRHLFKSFKQIRIDVQNFDAFSLKGKTLVPREKLLNNVGRVFGLDLYVTATK